MEFSGRPLGADVPLLHGDLRRTEEDLGHVALTLRRSAMLNDNSVMQNPLTMDEYLSSRYIVAPMHLLDMCLVNDGAVCVIMRRTERAGDGPHLPVLVSGWGYDGYRQEKLRTMVQERPSPSVARRSQAGTGDGWHGSLRDRPSRGL